MTAQADTRWFSDLQSEDIATVGGKNAALGELYGAVAAGRPGPQRLCIDGRPLPRSTMSRRPGSPLPRRAERETKARANRMQVDRSGSRIECIVVLQDTEGVHRVRVDSRNDKIVCELSF